MVSMVAGCTSSAEEADPLLSRPLTMRMKAIKENTLEGKSRRLGEITHQDRSSYEIE
jgi:hypothetical protein